MFAVVEMRAEGMLGAPSIKQLFLMLQSFLHGDEGLL